MAATKCVALPLGYSAEMRVVVTDRALVHMARYRQLSWYFKEAGGQLFGNASSSEVVV
jgi:hypothetical protein